MKSSHKQTNKILNYKDDFTNGINPDLWSEKRVNKPSCVEVGSFFGKSALKVTVNQGDCQGIGNDGRITERTELTEKEKLQIRLDTPIWYSFLFYISEDFFVVNNRLVFAQWKQATGKPESPFMSWRFINNKLFFQVVHEYQHIDFDSPSNENIKGYWHEIVVYYQLNSNKMGSVKTWLDNSLFAEYEGEMGSSDPVTDKIQFKFGIYRDQLELPQSIYFTNIKRSVNKLLKED